MNKLYIKKKTIKKNPATMWKENKEITIRFKNSVDIKFICLYDENADEYFYSEKAHHGYAIRLFNKSMDIIVDEIIYTKKEMENIAIEKYLKATKQRSKAMDVLKQVMPELDNAVKPLEISIKKSPEFLETKE